MKKVFFKLDDKIYRQAESMAKVSMLPIDKYITIAIEYFNKINTRQLLAEQFKSESKIVSESSMQVLNEFEKFDIDF